MQVLFSQVEASQEQNEEIFQDIEGNSYYYSVGDSPYCEEEFLIQDSTGRYVPFPLEDIDVVIEALENYRVNLVESFFSEPDSVALLD